MCSLRSYSSLQRTAPPAFHRRSVVYAHHSASEYCNIVEGEVQKDCNVILGLLDQSLIPKAPDVESMVFFEKMKKFYQQLMVLAEWSPPDRAGL